jgi:hypothetical protein
MHTPQQLLDRLEAIGRSLAESGHGLALLGLGSVGVELNRLDAYSDLDFFAIVEPGYKEQFLYDLRWLSAIQPLAFSFQNTRDGHKVLFEDGIFCEFAIFEPAELSTIPYAEGRIVWKAAGVDEAIRHPLRRAEPKTPPSTEWLLGEALTCLYVGLSRHRRGEVLSAQRFIQHFAVDRILELAHTLEAAQPAHSDPFVIERRFEQHFPQLARHLPDFIQGYNGNEASALALLSFIEDHFGVNPALKARIKGLIDGEG